MITENLSTLKIHKLTQAQYDRERENGTLDESALYLTPDETVDLSGYATVEQLATKANSTHTHNASEIITESGFADSLDLVIAEIESEITQLKGANETDEVMYGEGAPNSLLTVADDGIGTLYWDNTNKNLYVCTNVTGDGETVVNTYTWELASSNAESYADFGIITEGDGATYTATVDGITALTIGASFIMIPHTVSTTTAPKLNVNGLGAKTIRRMVSNSSTSTAAGYNASWLGANKPIRVTYNGTFWITDLTKPSAADMSGTLTVSNGGTGKTSVTAGSFLVGNGTSAMTEMTPTEVLTALGLATETWTFTLEDGSTVTKAVYIG